MMIISGTTRIVVKRRMLPRWSRAQRRILSMDGSRVVPLPDEAEDLDVLPGDVQASVRSSPTEDRGAEIDVVGVDAGTVGQRDVGRVADMRGGHVGRQRAVADWMPLEGDA